MAAPAPAPAAAAAAAAPAPAPAAPAQMPAQKAAAAAAAKAQSKVREMVAKALWSAEGGDERAGWADAWPAGGDPFCAAAATASPAPLDARPPSASNLDAASAFPWLHAAVASGDVDEAVRVQDVLGRMVGAPGQPIQPTQQQQQQQQPPQQQQQRVVHAPGGPLALPPLALAAERGDVAMLRAIARGGGGAAATRVGAREVSPITGMHALAVAVAAGKTAVVQELLSAGGLVCADPNAPLGPEYGPAPAGTALHAAVTNMSAEERARSGADADEKAVDDALEALLQAPPASSPVVLEARDALGCTPLLLAARFARERALRMLLDRGASAAAVDDEKRGALAHLLTGVAARVRVLASSGAPDDAKAAALERMARLLLDRGAPAHEGLDSRSMCPVFYAAAVPCAGVLRMLLDAPGGKAALKLNTRKGTALHYAAGGNEAGAATLQRWSYYGPAAWRMRLPPSRAAVVKMLLPRRSSRGAGEGGVVGGGDDDGGCGHPGAAAADAEAAGCDPNAADALGRTPAYVAVARGDAESLRLLLNAGADPSAVSAKGNISLIHKAVEDGRRSESALMLLRHAGCDVRATRPKVMEGPDWTWTYPGAEETAADVCAGLNPASSIVWLSHETGYNRASFLKVMGALVRRGTPFSRESPAGALRVLHAVLKHLQEEDDARGATDPAGKERRRILEQEDMFNFAMEWRETKEAEAGVERRMARLRKLEAALRLRGEEQGGGDDAEGEDEEGGEAMST